MPEAPTPKRELHRPYRLADLCLEAAEDVGVRFRQAQDADEIARLVRTHERLGRVLRAILTLEASL